MSRSTASRPSALRGALFAALLGSAGVLASCGAQPSSSGTSRTPAKKPVETTSEVEQQLADSNPFADIEAPAKKQLPVNVPTTLVGQRALLDDPVWHACVEKAHQAYITFNNADRMRDAEDQGYREEVQKGKRLLDQALEESWGIEDELSRQIGKARTHEALMRVRIQWNDKLRAVAKIVRG